jgi:ribosomal protein S18 acetylase RimI-like enzyme
MYTHTHSGTHSLTHERPDSPPQVPFVATHENKRGRGFGRCVVEAIEDVARALGIGRLLLCSTVEEHVQSTWKHLGFTETTELDLEALDVRDPDLVHMQASAARGAPRARAAWPPRAGAGRGVARVWGEALLRATRV